MSLTNENEFKNACVRGDIQIVRQYIESGTFDNELELGDYAAIAAENNQLEIVVYLINNGAHIQNDVILYPARFGFIELIDYLMKNYFTDDKIRELFLDESDNELGAFITFIDEYIYEAMKEACLFKNVNTLVYFDRLICTRFPFYTYDNSIRRYLVDKFFEPLNDDTIDYLRNYRIYLETLV